MKIRLKTSNGNSQQGLSTEVTQKIVVEIFTDEFIFVFEGIRLTFFNTCIPL